MKNLIACLALIMCCQMSLADQGTNRNGGNLGPQPSQPSQPAQPPRGGGNEGNGGGVDNSHPGQPDDGGAAAAAAAEAEREKELAERMERARNAFSQVTVSTVGVDANDCLQKVEVAADQRAQEAVEDCNRQADGLMFCDVDSKNITQFPIAIAPTSTNGDYNEIESTEAACRSTAIARAESNALSTCQSNYSVACEISSNGVVTDYHVDTHRRYFLFGPEDTHQVCTAVATAVVSAPYTVQCSMQVTARSHEDRRDDDGRDRR